MVVVVYCSVIKVLCLCRSFQATACLFYQKLLSLSRTFLFFFHCRIRLITSHQQCIYAITFELFCQPLFKISYKFLSSLLINLFFELFLSQGLSASAPSSYSSVCSVVFSAVLSDECYLIIAISNCQCFLYILCNSEYSEKLASAFPNPNSYCKLACSKLIGLGNIGRMPLTERTSVLSVVTDA